MITCVRVTARCGVVPGPHQQQAGELAGRAGRRLQGGRVHAGDLAQRTLQVASSSSQPWVEVAGRGGWTSARPGSEAAVVAELGVVLHRARAERVGAEVDRGVLAVGEAGEVGDQVALGDLGQTGGSQPAVSAGHQLVGRPLGHASGRGTTTARRPGATARRPSGLVRRVRVPAEASRRRTRAGHSREHLLEGGGVGVDLGPGASLGDGDEQAVAVGPRPAAERRRGSPRRPCARPRSAATGSWSDRTPAASARRRPARRRRSPAPPPGVAGAPGAAQRQLAQAGGARASDSWMAHATAISVWLVQTLDDAFSRRMSCSRAWSVGT